MGIAGAFSSTLPANFLNISLLFYALELVYRYADAGDSALFLLDYDSFLLVVRDLDRLDL